MNLTPSVGEPTCTQTLFRTPYMQWLKEDEQKQNDSSLEQMHRA